VSRGRISRKGGKPFSATKVLKKEGQKGSNEGCPNSLKRKYDDFQKGKSSERRKTTEVLVKGLIKKPSSADVTLEEG